jgi:hypothetical protein
MSKVLDPRAGDTIYWQNTMDGVLGGTVMQRVGNEVYFKANIQGGYDPSLGRFKYPWPLKEWSVEEHSVFYDNPSDAYADLQRERDAANRAADSRRNDPQP